MMERWAVTRMMQAIEATYRMPPRMMDPASEKEALLGALTHSSSEELAEALLACERLGGFVRSEMFRRAQPVTHIIPNADHRHQGRRDLEHPHRVVQSGGPGVDRHGTVQSFPVGVDAPGQILVSFDDSEGEEWVPADSVVPER